LKQKGRVAVDPNQKVGTFGGRGEREKTGDPMGTLNREGKQVESGTKPSKMKIKKGFQGESAFPGKISNKSRGKRGVKGKSMPVEKESFSWIKLGETSGVTKKKKNTKKLPGCHGWGN